MRVKIYRALEEEEKQEYNALATLIRDQNCKKITLQIREMNGLPFITSIHIDDEWVLLDDYKDMTFLQVFEK